MPVKSKEQMESARTRKDRNERDIARLRDVETSQRMNVVGMPQQELKKAK